MLREGEFGILVSSLRGNPPAGWSGLDDRVFAILAENHATKDVGVFYKLQLPKAPKEHHWEATHKNQQRLTAAIVSALQGALAQSAVEYSDNVVLFEDPTAPTNDPQKRTAFRISSAMFYIVGDVADLQRVLQSTTLNAAINAALGGLPCVLHRIPRDAFIATPQIEPDRGLWWDPTHKDWA